MEYQIINIKTVIMDNGLESGLSFFEGEHDIPFKINCLYCVYESEKNNLKGFYTNKQSYQLMFCPYGIIEVLIDDGNKKEKVLLDNPSVGLILPLGIWREVTWKKSDSIFCVAASGYHDPEKMKNDYELYIEVVRDKTSLKKSEELEG